MSSSRAAQRAVGVAAQEASLSGRSEWPVRVAAHRPAGLAPHTLMAFSLPPVLISSRRTSRLNGAVD